LPADVVEQLEAGSNLDPRHMSLEWVRPLLVVDSTVILEDRSDLVNLVGFVSHAIGLIADSDGVVSKHLLENEVADLSRKAQEWGVGLICRPPGIIRKCEHVQGIHLQDSFLGIF
jgi:hypothetical protein